MVSLSVLIISVGPAWSFQDTPVYPIMKPTAEELLDNLDRNSQFPRVKAPSLAVRALPAEYSVLDRLSYVPADHNQGSCGNCWIWAGTTLLDVALRTQEGIADRLSTQFATSGVVDMGLTTCCEGGTLWLFNQFYETAGMVVPWSNTGADYQAGGNTCAPFDSIATGTNYPVGRIDIRTVDTSDSQQEVITAIKSLLNDNKAVWFAFYLGQENDWRDFSTYWANENEDAVFDFSTYANHTWSDEGGGGHAVVIVGYEKNDWIVLNSWGTEGGNRPNVLFRMPQDMDYGAVINLPVEGEGGVRGFPMFEFAAIDVDFDPAVDPSDESVILEGNMEYDLNIFNDTVAMSAERITNQSPAGRTGTLYLSLWASPGDFDPRATGYRLARSELGELEGGQSFDNLSVSESLVYPPNGEYRITMVLSEWRADSDEPEETIQDYYQFPGTVTLTHESSSDSGGGGCFVDVLLHR